MQITRRGFLTMTGAIGGGVALSSFGLNLNPTRGYADELSKMDRIKIAKQVITTCAYCSVGCGLVCSVDKTTGKIFNIEGDADHPINEGSLCAKGAGFFDLTEANKHRLTKVLYRKPGGTEWEEKDWDFAIPRIARLVKDARDKGFVKTNAKGELVNSAQEIWDNELSVLAPSMAGIKYARLENDGIQWPAPNEDHPGTPTLHKDGKFTCGLGVLKAIDWIPPAEVPDKEYPFVLSTGRRLYHYHTRTQTGWKRQPKIDHCDHLILTTPEPCL